MAQQTLLFSLWFNTAFVSSQFKPGDETHTLVLQSSEIDKVNKDKNHKIVAKGFSVEITFGLMEADEAEQPEVYAHHSKPLDKLPIRGAGGVALEEQGAAVTVVPDVAGSAAYSDVLAEYPSLNNF